MTCDELDDYLDGSLTGTRLAAFQEHVKLCPRCRLELATQERLERSLAALSKALAPAPARLVRGIDSEIVAIETRRKSWRRWGAAAAFVLASVGIWIGSLLDGDARQGREDQGGPPDRGSDVPSVVRIVPDPHPIASVRLSEDSNALAVPVTTEGVDATIVFVYPILGGKGTSDRTQ